MPEIPRVPTIPNPSTIQARDESVDRARALLERERGQARNLDIIFKGLGDLADVARQRFDQIAGAEAVVASDQAFTELSIESMSLERDIADSETPDQAILSYWETFDRSVNRVMDGLPSRAAQRTFQGAANQYKRQRVPYVLRVAEERTSELMIDQFNLRLAEMVDAGDVEQIPGLFRQYSDYLNSTAFAPGGPMETNIARARDRRYELVGKAVFDERGASAAAEYFLATERGGSFTERQARLRMVDSWSSQKNMETAEQRSTELSEFHGDLEELRGQGRGYEITPHLLQRMADDLLPSWTLDERGTLVARLLGPSGAAANQARYNDLREQMQDAREAWNEARLKRERDEGKAMSSFYLTQASLDLTAEQIPEFKEWVRELQVAGMIDQEDAEAFLERASGVRNEHMAIGEQLVEDHFARMTLNNYALEQGEDWEVVGNRLYHDGTLVTTGPLDGARLDVVHPDGRPDVLLLPNEMAYVLREYRRMYKETEKRTKQVPEDPGGLAMRPMDQWLRTMMPGTQMGEVQADGPRVWYPGSGIPGTLLYPQEAEAITWFEQRFTKPVQFDDASAAAGLEAGGGKPERQRWFSDARVIQMGLDEMRQYQPAEIDVVSAPLWEEMTGETAMRLAGVMQMSRNAVDDELLEWNSMMQAGQFQLAGQIAARRLPAEEGVLQGLQDQGAIAGFRMVPGRGAMVQLHPMSAWVPVPITKPLPRLMAPALPLMPRIPVPEAAMRAVERSSREEVSQAEEERVDRLLGADIESESPFAPIGRALEAAGDALEQGWDWWTGGDLTKSSSWQQSSSAQQFGAYLTEGWDNLWGNPSAAVDVEAAVPDARWAPESQAPLYGGLYNVADVTETSLSTLRLWLAGGQGTEVEGSAQYLENVSRNARGQLSGAVARELDNTLDQYRTARRRLKAEEHRPEPATTLPTAVDPPPIGGVRDGPIGAGYSGLQRVTEAEMGWRQTGAAQTFPGPAMSGAQMGQPAAVAGIAQPGVQTQPYQPPGAVVQRGQPGYPAGVAQPGTQGEPYVPPGAVAQPGQPGYPAGVAQPGAQGAVARPGQPAAAAAIGQPGAQAAPYQPPAAVARPGQPTEAAAIAQPVAQGAVARPGQPAEAGAPAQPGAQGQPYVPPGAVARPGQPGEIQPAHSGIPAPTTEPNGASAPVSTWQRGADPDEPLRPLFPGEAPIPPVPPDPSIAWEPPPAFKPIGIDTDGNPLYVAMDPTRMPTAGGAPSGLTEPGVPAMGMRPLPHVGGMPVRMGQPRAGDVEAGPGGPRSASSAGRMTQPGMPARGPRPLPKAGGMPIRARRPRADEVEAGPGGPRSASSAGGLTEAGVPARGPRPLPGAGEMPVRMRRPRADEVEAAPRSPGAAASGALTQAGIPASGSRGGASPGEMEAAMPTRLPAERLIPETPEMLTQQRGQPTLGDLRNMRPDALSMASPATPTFPGGTDVFGEPYVALDTPTHPQLVFRNIDEPPVIAVPIGVDPDGYLMFQVIREPMAPPQPTAGAAPGQPGYPEGVVQPGTQGQPYTPPGAVAQPGQPGHAAAIAQQFGTQGEPYQPPGAVARPGQPAEAQAIAQPGASASAAAPAHPTAGAAAGQPGEIQPVHSDRLAPGPTTEPAGAAPPEQRGATPGEPGEPSERGAPPRQRYEPRESDLPEAPEYNGESRFMDRPPLELPVPYAPGARTLEGAPYPDRQQTEPTPPPEQLPMHRGEPDVPGMWPVRGLPAPSAMPPVQEYMAQVSAADEVEARAAAHRLATDTIFGGAQATDAETVMQALQAMDRTGEEMPAGELPEQAMAAWYLTHRYPDWDWWNEQPEWTERLGGQEAMTNAPIRQVPEPAEWAQNADMQQLIRVLESRPLGDVQNGQLIAKDVGGGEWTIGYGSRYVYTRNTDGTIQETEATSTTRLPHDLPEGERDQTAEEVAESQFVRGLEYHYGHMKRKFEQMGATDALNWLNDSQLAALTAMSYHRGHNAMTDRPSGRALVQALRDRDLAGINRAWWSTFNEASGVEKGYVRGWQNRRSAEAAVFFHGFPEEITDRWKTGAATSDDVVELRTRALHGGITPDDGHLVTAGHERLSDLLPVLGDMDIKDRMKAWGMDPAQRNETYLWITGRNGAVPPHLQDHVEHSRRMGPYTVFFLSS